MGERLVGGLDVGIDGRVGGRVGSVCVDRLVERLAPDGSLSGFMAFVVQRLYRSSSPC